MVTAKDTPANAQATKRRHILISRTNAVVSRTSRRISSIFLSSPGVSILVSLYSFRRRALDEAQEFVLPLAHLIARGLDRGCDTAG